jgi:hypothetical protein
MMDDGCISDENGTGAMKSRADGLESDSHVMGHDVDFDTDTDLDLYSIATIMTLT